MLLLPSSAIIPQFPFPADAPASASPSPAAKDPFAPHRATVRIVAQHQRRPQGLSVYFAKKSPSSLRRPKPKSCNLPAMPFNHRDDLGIDIARPAPRKLLRKFTRRGNDRTRQAIRPGKDDRRPHVHLFRHCGKTVPRHVFKPSGATDGHRIHAGKVSVDLRGQDVVDRRKTSAQALRKSLRGRAFLLRDTRVLRQIREGDGRGVGPRDEGHADDR